MSISKYDCTTMYDAPEPYAIMVQEVDGSYVSADDYEALKEAAYNLLYATNHGVRNCSAEVKAKEALVKILGLEITSTESTDIESTKSTEEIKWKKFDGTEASCDSLYMNTDYDNSFRFKTNDGSIFTGNIAWEQGRGNNYRFYVGSHGSEHIYHPDDITHIEIK